MKHKKQPKIAISLLMWVFEYILLSTLRISDEWIESVRQASARGPIVFFLRNRNLIDFLCLHGICRRYGLPSLGFVSGLSPFWFLPLWKWIPALFTRRNQNNQRQRLHDTLASGGSALVFLRRPALRDAFGSRPVALDGARLSVEVQRALNTPVIALPTVFLWGENPMKRARGNLSFLFGTSEYPRLIRSIWLLIRRRSDHGQWCAQSLDIGNIESDNGGSVESRTAILRAAVGRGIEEIRRERLGTFTKPSSRIKAEVIASRRLRSEISKLPETAKLSDIEVTRRIGDIVEKLATDFKPHVVAAFAVVMAFFWKRLYTAFDIRKEDMEKLRTAVGKGSLLILPCHRSHVDYLAITQSMSTANIMLPHIAAGDNLMFWPMGPIFRASGAFFIRRRFVNDLFYTAVVNTYIRRLIYEGYAIEVFIEGGRSRTGKLLRPKLGMLEMVLHSMATIPGRNPGIMPTFIGYERVIEEGEYLREAQGKKKKSESTLGLLKSASVLLNRYGRLYVRMGEYFTVGDVLQDLGHTVEELAGGNVRRDVAQEISVRTLADIQKQTVTTAVSVLATALLSHRTSTVSRAELWSRVCQLTRFLGALDVPMSEEVAQWFVLRDSRTAPDSFHKALKILRKENRILIDRKADTGVVEIRHGQRNGIDYYKNNIIHYFVPSALIGVAIARGGETGVDRSALVETMSLTARLFQWEFVMPAHRANRDEEFSSKMAEMTGIALKTLQKLQIIDLADSRVILRNRAELEEIVKVLRSCFESYHVVLTVTRDRANGNLSADPLKEATHRFEKSLKEKAFFHSEGKNQIVFQTGFSAMKDLKINRPIDGDRPFEEDGLGAQFITYLEDALDISR